MSKSASEPTLAACLIVRNEAPFLADCLQSLAGVDALIVVDTGSADDTVAIATRLGARVAHFSWGDDFAAARNAALALATADWVLAIDADQRLVGGIAAVRASIRQVGTRDTILCPAICNRDATGQPASRYRSGQLFARVPGRHYVGRIHERVVDAVA
ncbi:MAG: glycosyltransferase, partial [Candidatus Sericytochromatia bacterium]|nr:glycosyltransferase [Candidatus Sericytochromatia bacterium]